MSARRFAAIAYVCIGGLAGACACAQVSTPGIAIAVGSQAQYDTNVLRLPDGVDPHSVGINGSRGDLVLQPFVEIDAAAGLGRQLLHGFVHARRLDLRSNHQFDSDNLDAGLDWDWAFGNDWGGRIGASRRQESTGFADFLGPERNVLTVREQSGRVDWHVRPDRRVTAAFDRYDGSNSAQARSTSDYTVRNATLSIAAQGNPGDEASVSATHTDGRYPNRQLTLFFPIDNSYTQDSADANVRAATALWSLDVRAGFARRRYRSLADRDFQGATGGLRAAWRPTGKTSLEAAWRRDLNAVDEYDNLFVVQTSRRLTATLEATPMVSVSADALWRDNDFRGEPLNLAIAVLGPRPRRLDRYADYTVAVTWMPADRFKLQLQRAWSTRDSTRDGLQYAARIWAVSARYEWR